MMTSNYFIILEVGWLKYITIPFYNYNVKNRYILV